ncbi:DUF6588 family protein [bacterium]
MKKRCFIIVGLLCIVLALSSVQAQDDGMEEQIKKYAESNGQLYLQPLADAFGANMNGGIFHGAKISKWGFHLNIGVVGMGAFIKDEQRTFEPKDEYDIHPIPGKLLPTIFGKTESVDWDGIELPGGVYEADIVPLVVPQLTIGNVMGTRAVVRWIEINIAEEIGKIGLFGIGVQHSISQYIPLIPVDIAVGGFWQSFSIGDLVKANTIYVGLNVGYSLSILHFYGGIGYETSSLDIHFESEVEGSTEPFIVDFTLEGANSMRTTIGLLLDIPVVKIFADYNLAAQNTVTLGIAFGI